MAASIVEELGNSIAEDFNQDGTVHGVGVDPFLIIGFITQIFNMFQTCKTSQEHTEEIMRNFASDGPWFFGKLRLQNLFHQQLERTFPGQEKYAKDVFYDHVRKWTPSQHVALYKATKKS